MPRLCWLALFLMSPVLGATGSYDHFQHGFDLEGAHRSVPCESCHVQAIFRGTPKECGYCHDGTGLYAKSARAVTHPLTTDNCESCHEPVNWSAIASVDHGEVLGTCSSCHDGQRATGKDPLHIASSGQCDDCHTTAAWIPAVFDHASITGSCASCHDGQRATGKDPLHIASSDQCDDCHTTAAWVPAVFDHGAVLPGSCNGCHDGQMATGQDPGHIATNATCDDCHSTIAWTPAIFDHASAAPGSCAGCHDGQAATGMGGGHFRSSESCDTCHTTEFWIPHTYLHTGLPYEPLDHRGNFDCAQCHAGNSEIVSWSAPAYQPDCAGCHASDYRPGEDDHNGIGIDRDCAASGCHRIDRNDW